MKTDEEKYLVASNGDHAHACITVGGGYPMGTVTARIGLGYVLLYESPRPCAARTGKDSQERRTSVTDVRS